MKATIEDLRNALQAAKQKQKDAKEECKQLERDMDEFKNNKDGKIEELKVSWSASPDFLLTPLYSTLLYSVPFHFFCWRR